MKKYRRQPNGREDILKDFKSSCGVIKHVLSSDYEGIDLRGIKHEQEGQFGNFS